MKMNYGKKIAAGLFFSFNL